MATGGGSPEINDGHEESFDWNCNVCQEEDIVTEAVVFCQNCNKCLCKHCLRNHNRFLKNHTLLGQEEKQYWGIESSSILPRMNIGCTKHAKQPVLLYCDYHDDVCCALCALESHSRNCKNHVVPISNVTNSLASTDEYNHVRDDIRRLVSTFFNTENDILLGQSTLKLSRDRCKSNIDAFVEQLINRLIQLQKVSIDKSNQLYDKCSEDITHDLHVCTETKEELISIETQLDKRRGEIQEEDAFITMKLIKKKLPAFQQKLNALSTHHKKIISFIANKSFLQIVRFDFSLGSIVIAADSGLKNNTPDQQYHQPTGSVIHMKRTLHDTGKAHYKQLEVDVDTNQTMKSQYRSEDKVIQQRTSVQQQRSNDKMAGQQELKSKITSCSTHEMEATEQKRRTTNDMDYSVRSSDEGPMFNVFKPFHVSYTEERTKPESPISSTDSSSQGDTDSSFVVLKDSDVSSEDYQKEEEECETHVSFPKLLDKDNETLSRKTTEKVQYEIADTKQFDIEKNQKEEDPSNNKFSSKDQDETYSYRMVKVFGKYILEDKYGNKVTLPKYFKSGPNVTIDKNFIKDETCELYEIIRAKGKIALKLVKKAKTVQSDDESSDGGTTSDITDSTENPDKYPDKKKEKDECTQDSRYADKKNRIEENAKQTLTDSQSDLFNEKRKEEKDRYDVDDGDCGGDDVADDDDDDDEVNVNNNNLYFDGTDYKTKKSSLSSGDEAQSIPSGITLQKTEDKSDSSQPMPPSRNKTDTKESYQIQLHVKRETYISPSRITRLLSLDHYLILQYVCRNMTLFDISVRRLKKVFPINLEVKDDTLSLTILNVDLTADEGISIAIEYLLKDTDHLMIISIPTAGIDNDIFLKMLLKSAMGVKNEIFACAGANNDIMHCIYPERLKKDAEALFELCINRLKIIDVTKTYPPMFAEKVQELLVDKYSRVKTMKEEKQLDEVKLSISGPKYKVEAFSDDVDRCLKKYCVNTISFKEIKFYTDCCEHLDLEQALQELVETESTEDSDVMHFINLEQNTVSVMAKNQSGVDMFTYKVKRLLKEQTIKVPYNLQTTDICETLFNKVKALGQNIVISEQGLSKITIIGLRHEVDTVLNSFEEWFSEQRDIKKLF